jgi:hypothetical protein
MQKRSFLVVTMFLIGMFLTGIYAQTITVSGSVTSKEMSDPLIGVNVLVKGTTNGTVTDLNGHYSITVGPDDVLVFSYISMQTVEEAVKGRKVIDVSMVSDTESLGEVVVTAMGIQRQSETLTYSAQTVGGSDVNDIKSVNMINSLQGKSAGLMITPNSTGAGGSSKILFRGNKSISGSNQPLIVVDGVPVMNSVSGAQVSSNYGGERDGGDVMSTINPDDIASITLLKGASAAVWCRGCQWCYHDHNQVGSVGQSFNQRVQQYHYGNSNGSSGIPEYIWSQRQRYIQLGRKTGFGST